MSEKIAEVAGSNEEDLAAFEKQEALEFEREFEAEEEVDPSNLVASVPAEKPEPKIDSEGQPIPDEEIKEEDQPLDQFQELENRLASRMRKIEGHFGGLKSQMQEALKSALDSRDETISAGGDAPTKKEIKDTAGSRQKLEALKAEYPEWGITEAIDEQVGGLESRLNDKFNPDKIQGDLSERMESAITNSTVRLREVLRVDMAHPGWETTVSSDEFQYWKDSQGEDIQVLADSQSSIDAIKMLNAYEAHRNPKPAAEDKEADRRQRRLEGAVAPTTARVPAAKRGPTEEEDFLAGFNE